jgi:hypothetical protein
MLASTVQFSNNDQPPTTPNHKDPSTPGPATEGKNHSLRHPTVCPTPPTTHNMRSTPRRAVLTAAHGPKIPNSQRSTHEQPASDIRR